MYVYLVTLDTPQGYEVLKVCASEQSARDWIAARQHPWRYTVERRRVWFAMEVAEEIAGQEAMTRVTSKEED